MVAIRIQQILGFVDLSWQSQYHILLEAQLMFFFTFIITTVIII
jgi:hypothetical protein